MFTPSQQTAINTPTKDMLVSAGAGSGKTTVLTKRIMQKIEQGHGVKDFLVVTFTKTAAADLRKKLSHHLEQLSIANPQSPRYRKLLYALPGADIGTIDGFCLQHVKQNAVQLGLVKGVSVGDEALCAALLTAAAEKLLTDLCEADDPTADVLLDNFASHKSDSGLINAMCKLYNSLRKFPFYLQWLDSVLAAHKEEEQALTGADFFACPHGKAIKDIIGGMLKKARAHLDTLHSVCDDDKQGQFAAEVEEAFGAMEQGFKVGYLHYCAAAQTYKVRKRPTVKNAAFVGAYNAYKAVVDTRLDLARTKEELEKEYSLTGAVLAAATRFIKELDREYTAAKAGRGIIDFADAEQLFLTLLIENKNGAYIKTPLCRSISAAYKEVFIDEYQDVSPLQDAIFSAIGQGKRFMVGDLKQSIYGFRDAYPDIFMGYRNGFSPAEDKADTAKVFLRENFRCDKNVIDFCNYVFDRTFTAESADTDYREERLVFGKSQTQSYPVQLTVLENDQNGAEADYVAEQVVRLIYDGRQPKDIALLARKTADVQALAAALTKRGVPCATEKTTQALLKRAEVLLALSLLRVIDNPTDDISLAALLRSPVFRFTADDLLAIRGGGGSLYGDLCATARSTARAMRYRLRRARLAPPKSHPKPRLVKAVDGALKQKCAEFLACLQVYRAKALILPVHTLIWYLYEDTHLFAYAPQGEEQQHKDNLFALYELARGIESGGYKGLAVFVEYINRLEADDRSPKAATPTADNAVAVMTMHGSKGLEYPVVFVCACGTTLRKTDSAPLIVNYRNGIGIKLANQKEGWRTDTLLLTAARWQEAKRTVAEEYRLLYVAFTRAKEQLFVSAALRGAFEDYLDTPKAEPSLQCDLFLPTVARAKEAGFCLTVADGTKEVPQTVLAGALARVMPVLDLPPLDAEPPAPQRVTAKYSVSQVKLTENGTFAVAAEKRVTDRVPLFAGGGEGGGLVRGTANHAFLQFASFALAEKDVAAEANRLLAKGFISPGAHSLLNIPALERFFASGIYGMIKSSPRVYREKRFTTKLPATLFGAEGEDVLVQGVIDCFFENQGGGYTLVDYKTDALRPGEEQLLAQRYRTQLYLYSLYIKKLTGKPVTDAYLYSLSLNKAVFCDITNITSN